MPILPSVSTQAVFSFSPSFHRSIVVERKAGGTMRMAPVRRKQGDSRRPLCMPGTIIIFFLARHSGEQESMRRLKLDKIDRQILRDLQRDGRSDEHTSELTSLMRNTYAVFCLSPNTRK